MAYIFELFTLQEILLCCGAVLVASILQITIGMGFGMLAAPLIALVKPEIVPGSILVMGLVVAFSGAWQERGNILPVELRMGIGGRLIGSAMAFAILLLIPSIDVFLIIFGSVMLFAILLASSGWQLPFTNKSLLNLSVVSGLMGTLTGVGAPPMALIYHTRPADVVRPTLNAFFGAACVLGLLSLAFSGWLTFDDVLAAFFLLPAMLLGILIGSRLRTKSSVWLSKALLALSGGASLLLILRGLQSVI